MTARTIRKEKVLNSSGE